MTTNKKINATLSKKDRAFREFALNANAMHVVLFVGTPLALYQSLTQLFKIFDTMMASHISSAAVSAVAYISQIHIMLSAIGGGLAVGAGIKISEAYGAGDFLLVKRRVSTLFALCAALGALLLVLLLPTARSFMRLMGTPESFIQDGNTYFCLELIALVITFFDSIYISIERARGNSKRILYLNLGVIAIKLSLTAIAVYKLHLGIFAIAVATIVSQSMILIAAFINMRGKDNAFGFSFAAISLLPQVSLPMLSVSFPVIVEKAAFAIGKIVINSMSTVYGKLTVGALGISNNIGGIATMPQNGFQDGSAAIIGQNRGANKEERIVKVFWATLVCCVVVGAAFMTMSLLCLKQISTLFANKDIPFRIMIQDIYRYEAIGAVPLGVNAAVLSLLYGLGKTKITLIMNFCRVAVFRVPVMWVLQHFTKLGSESAGIVMAVSNFLSGVLAAVICVIVLFDLKKKIATKKLQSTPQSS